MKAGDQVRVNGIDSEGREFRVLGEVTRVRNASFVAEYISDGVRCESDWAIAQPGATYSEGAAIHTRRLDGDTPEDAPVARELVVPRPGLTVHVVPVGCEPGDGQCWQATLVKYTPNGEFIVRSAHPGATSTQVVSRVYVEVPR